MVVKSFQATSLQMLDDLVNDFIKAKEIEWKDKYDTSFKYTISYQVVQAWYDYDKDITRSPTFTAMIQY